ncbi:MAG: hypothetical protein KGN16_00015 [Burkholderiales bacterium]|nr:hypothetical protein [Burkholderiales bacterium]
MTGGRIGPVEQRDRRKQQLLLASRLARVQAAGAFDELAGSTDAIANRAMQVRAWLGSPVAWIIGTAIGGLLLRLTRSTGQRPSRQLRWGWAAWQLWRRYGAALGVRWRTDRA